MKLKEVALVLDVELTTDKCIPCSGAKFWASLKGIHLLDPSGSGATALTGFGDTITEAKKNLCKRIRGKVVTKNVFTKQAISFQLPKTITL